MKPDQLRYFLEAARHQHIGKAARMIPISPSAVSHSIEALEQELGRELFVKRGKRIYLTEHGRILMERAQKLLSELESVREELSSDRVELRGHYKLVATHVLCDRLLAPAWTRLQRDTPQLSAEMYTFRSAHAAAAVASGEFDFGLCFNPQPHPGLNAKLLHESEMSFVVRRGHPLARLGSAARIARLSDYSAALPKAFQGIDSCEAHPMFGRLNVKPNVRFLFDSYEVAAENVLGSDAWGLFPDWIAETYGGRLLSFKSAQGWRAPAVVTAIWPKDRLMGRVLKRLVAEIGRQPVLKPARRRRIAPAPVS